MDLVDALDHTFAHAHDVIAGVRPDQYDDTTPCERWSVRDLLDHMIGVVARFGSAASGQPPSPFTLDADHPAAQFQAAAARALKAWRAEGVLDDLVDGVGGPMPGRVLAGINLLDTATHTGGPRHRHRPTIRLARRRRHRGPRYELGHDLA